MGYENIPQEMKILPRWLVWKLEDWGGKKPTKTPYSVHSGYAKVNDPATWGTFEQAVTACQGGYNGIGFVFTDTPYVGVDIDGCIDPSGTVTPEAADIVQRLATYTERSQSGSGFHIILNGKLPDGRRRNGSYEMYGSNSPRYFAMTGDLYGDHREIRADQSVIDQMHRQYIAVQETSWNTPIGEVLPDDTVIAKAHEARNGALFAQLWNGDTTGYGGDDSRADQALCNLLAFWTGRNADQTDRLFRMSGLYRPKWNERHGKDTYGNLTIGKAIADCREVYSSRHGQTAAQQDLRESTEEWEQPIPFESIDTPNFPTESLPAPVASFVEALAESTQTPDEMAAVLSLGVLAVAFQSRFEVEITSDWREPLCLYPVAIAPPGERKSGVISALTTPIYEYEAMRRDLEAVDIAKNKQERRMLERALESAEKAATKPPAAKKAGAKEGFTIQWDTAVGGESPAKQKALEIAEQLVTFEDKHPYRLLVDDTTPEKLADIMDMRNGCIAIASAEGGIFDSLAGRYDRGANFDVYLKGHAGDPIVIDRIGRQSNYIRHPRLTMILTIQPEVLTELMNNTTFRGRGLCGRFLYAVCKSKVGRRNIDAEPIAPEVKSGYRQFVHRILSGQDTGVIRLSPEARKLYVEYAAYIERKLGDEWEWMRDWGGKIVGAMLRIAGLIHASEVQGIPQRET